MDSILHTSDTHFFHENIKVWARTQYTTVEEMNDDMVRIWNENVSPSATVWHHGDWAFQTGQRKEEVIALRKRLNGNINFIYGNHDYEKRVPAFGFQEIHKEAFVTIHGVKFRMTHYPYKSGMTESDKVKRPECFVEEIINPETGKVYPLLHGHVHAEYKISMNSLNVGWDVFHRPISQNEILKIYGDTNGFTEKLDKYNKA